MTRAGGPGFGLRALAVAAVALTAPLVAATASVDASSEVPATWQLSEAAAGALPPAVTVDLGGARPDKVAFGADGSRGEPGSGVMEFGEAVPLDGRTLAELAGREAWAQLPGGGRLLRVHFRSANATHLIFRFTALPAAVAEGGALWAYGSLDSEALHLTRSELAAMASAQGSRRWRPSSADAAVSTGPLAGEVATFELYEPPLSDGAQQPSSPGAIAFEGATRVDRDIPDDWSRGRSGARRCTSAGCQVDITCPEGAGWSGESAGVFRLVMDTALCSASLIADPEGGEGRQLALTAQHCTEGSSGSRFWRAEFALERECGAGCTQPRGVVSVQGVTVLWQDDAPDISLIELDGEAPQDARRNGWDRRVESATLSRGGAVIHHPRGDFKKISATDDSLIQANVQGQFRLVARGFDFGTIQAGSSGSPLFDPRTSRIAGVTSSVDSCTFNNPCGNGGCGTPWFNFGSLAHAWQLGLGAVLSPSDSTIEYVDAQDVLVPSPPPPPPSPPPPLPPLDDMVWPESMDECADFDGNGEINVADALLLVQKIFAEAALKRQQDVQSQSVNTP